MQSKLDLRPCKSSRATYGRVSRRVESRLAEIPGFPLPSWQEVCDREYDPWDRAHIIVDTSGRSVEQTLTSLRTMLSTEN